MTIYYSPNPATKPATTSKQYALGDFYIDSASAVWKLATTVTGAQWQTLKSTDLKPGIAPASMVPWAVPKQEGDSGIPHC